MRETARWLRQSAHRDVRECVARKEKERDAGDDAHGSHQVQIAIARSNCFCHRMCEGSECDVSQAFLPVVYQNQCGQSLLQTTDKPAYASSLDADPIDGRVCDVCDRGYDD